MRNLTKIANDLRKLAENETGEDVTERMLGDLKYGPLPAYIKNIEPAKSLSPAKIRVLQQFDGTELGYVSKAIVYDDLFRNVKKVDHAILISLIAGGFMKVFRIDGPLPGNHKPSRVGAGAAYHYVLKTDIDLAKTGAVNKIARITNDIRKLAENPTYNPYRSHKFYHMHGYKGDGEYFFYKTNDLKNGNSYGYAIDIDNLTNFKPGKPKRISIYKTDIGTQWKPIEESDIPANVMSKFNSILQDGSVERVLDKGVKQAAVKYQVSVKEKGASKPLRVWKDFDNKKKAQEHIELQKDICNMKGWNVNELSFEIKEMP